jgi:hypothetical protein
MQTEINPTLLNVEDASNLEMLMVYIHMIMIGLVYGG